MSKRLLLIFSITVLFSAAGTVAISARAQAPQKAARPLGKLVFVLTKNDVATTMLQEPEIRILGGRQFIVCREANDNAILKQQYPGKTLWVPIDEVTQLVELANNGK